VSQNFTFTVCPLTVTSLTRGILILGVLPLTHSIDGVVESGASSVSGGLKLLGTIPGSLLDVIKRKNISKIVSIQDTQRIGIHRFGFLVRGSAILVYILTKNITAGPRIKMVDRYRDDASGPNISLPPHRNLLLPLQT
jgi:hypothetical protein